MRQRLSARAFGLPESQPPMLQILGRSSSINVREVLWLCAEIGCPSAEPSGAGLVPLRSPEFLALNPNALVPVLCVWRPGAVGVQHHLPLPRAASTAALTCCPTSPARARRSSSGWTGWPPSSTPLAPCLHGAGAQRRRVPDAKAIEPASRAGPPQARARRATAAHQRVCRGQRVTLATSCSAWPRTLAYAMQRPALPRSRRTTNGYRAPGFRQQAATASRSAAWTRSSPHARFSVANGGSRSTPARTRPGPSARRSCEYHVDHGRPLCPVVCMKRDFEGSPRS